MAQPVERPQAKSVMVGFKGEYFAGPLPHPDALAKYNDAFPGCPERIVKMAEDQAAHRQNLERMVIESNIKRQGVAQWLGFAAFLAVSGGAFSLFWLGKDATAIALLVGNLLTWGSAYVLGQRKQDRELAEKRKALEAPEETQNRPKLPPPAGEGS